MRIAVTGEGPTDYGKVDYGNPGHWIDGPVQVYLRRIAEEQNIELDFEMIERAEVQKIKLQRRHLNGLDGKAIPARRFYIKCKEKQLNYGVYYCDADRNAGEQNSNVHQLENSLAPFTIRRIPAVIPPARTQIPTASVEAPAEPIVL